MPRTLPLPSRPATEAEARSRLTAYAESWRASQDSTEPADRHSTEAAIAGLYRSVGLRRPTIVWVPSPLVGALAYQAIGSEHRAVLSPYAKGDVGTGSRREFYALRDPFGFPVRVEQAIAQRISRRTPAGRAEATNRLEDRGRRTIDAIRGEIERRVRTAIRTAAADRSTIEIDQRLGEVLLGSSAEPLQRLLGPDVFRMVAGIAVRHAFVDEMRGDHASTAMAMQPGQFDATTPAWAQIETVFGRPFYQPRDGSSDPRLRLAMRLKVARSAGPWWALDGLAIVSERPLRVRRDAEGRLHSERGPALAYGDGFGMHVWHGVAVEPWIIDKPDRITIEAIDRERNAEVRRVLVERFGPERMIREGGATLRAEDATGRLWERQVGPANSWPREEAIVMVEVLNSTPEPDGSSKTYFLRVPPRTQTAREGVAWTFGLPGDEYVPVVET